MKNARRRQGVPSTGQRPRRPDARGGAIDATRRSLLAAVPAAMLAGCVTHRDPRALSVWAMSYEGDYSPLLMPAFTRATGIPVEVQTLPWTAAHEKLLTAFAGGSLPDVLMLPNGWVGEFAMIGALAPVPDPALNAGVFPSVRGAMRYADRDYGVPWSVAPQMQYYRSDLLAAGGFDTVPNDWESWRRMGVALKRRRPDDYVVLAYLNWPDTLFTFAGQIGAPLLRDRNTRGNFAAPAFREALRYYKSLFDEGLAPRALSTELQDPVAAFARGYFAIYPSGPTLLLDLRRRATEISPECWSVARMPGPRGPGPVDGISACLAVAAHSPRQAEAWSLVRHMTSPASELQFQALIGNLPAQRSAWASPQLATARLAPFAAQMRQPAAQPAIVEMERIRTEVQLVAERVVRDQLSVDEGTMLMDRRVDALLAKRRSLVEAGRIA